MSDTVQQSILNKNRKDKFLLVLNLPPILKTVNKTYQNSRASNSLNLDSLQYSIYGTVVPETVVAEVDIPYSAQTAKFTSYTRSAYKPITVNFTVDNGFNNWWVLWKWLDYINGAQTSIQDSDNLNPAATDFQGRPFYASTGNLQPYQTTINVFGLDEYNNKKIRWTYSKAFITNLTGITYSYRDAEQLESSFTFSFSQLNAELL